MKFSNAHRDVSNFETIPLCGRNLFQRRARAIPDFVPTLRSLHSKSQKILFFEQEFCLDQVLVAPASVFLAGGFRLRPPAALRLCVGEHFPPVRPL